MRCASETSSLTSLSSLVKQNEIAFFSFPVFYKISLNWNLYLEVVKAIENAPSLRCTEDKLLD